MHRDQVIAVIGKIGSDLLQDVLAQGAGPRCRLLEAGAVLARGGAVARMPSGRLAGKVERSVALAARSDPPMLARLGASSLAKPSGKAAVEACSASKAA